MATKFDGPRVFTDFTDGAGWLLAPRSHESFMLAEGQRCPLCAIPGWHLSTLQWDLMHVGPLGVHQTAAACCLWELSREGVFGNFPGRDWKTRLNLQLRTAYGKFASYCSAEGIVHSQPPFSHCVLSMGAMNHWPVFKGKAANSFKVCVWLS